MLTRALSKSKRAVIGNAGHLMYLKKPAKFRRVAILFIESNND
jgi:hypothetical protein